MSSDLSGNKTKVQRGPPPPPPPQVSVGSTWNCEACTLRNSDSRDRCEVCGRVRTKEKKRVPPVRPPKLSMKEKQKILSKIPSVDRKDDVEASGQEEEKEEEEKRQTDDALKVELARIKAEKEEAERRLAAAESALRRMAEEQSVKKKSDVKKKTREEDMERLHELVPSAKSDMSVRAIYMKGARLLHPARGGDPKLYEELGHIYERLQQSMIKEEDTTLKKRRKSSITKKKNKNPFGSKNIGDNMTSTSTPLSEKQRLKIANFIRRERSKDWTSPLSSKNPFASRRHSNNPFSPASRERFYSPVKIKLPERESDVVTKDAELEEEEEMPEETNKPISSKHNNTVVGKPRIAILIEHEGVMMVPRREDGANDRKVVLNMRLVDSIRWICSCVEKSCVDVVIMKNSAPQQQEKEDDIFNWNVEYDVKTGRRIYSYRDATTQKRIRSWYSPYARQNETWIETMHPILPNSKVRVVYGEHVGMIGVATEWSGQLKRWKVRLEYDESDRDAEIVLLSPECLEDLNRGQIYVGPPVFYTNKKTRESTTTRPDDFDETARRHSRVASAVLKLRGVNSVSDIVVKGTLSRRVNAALDSLKHDSDEDVSMIVFVLTRDSGNARGTSRPIRTTGQVRSRLGNLKNILGRSRSDVISTNVIRFSRSPASLPVTPAHYVEEIMCRLTKMTMSCSRLKNVTKLIHWELANGEGNPPVLTQWRSESVSRNCKILMGTLGAGAFGM